MEQYISTTEAFLGIMQQTLTEKEFNRSAKAGEDMYEEIRKISEKHGLNMREMTNAVLSINLSVLEVIDEQVKEMKKQDLE